MILRKIIKSIEYMYDVYAYSKGYNAETIRKDEYLKGLYEARHRILIEEQSEYNLLKRAYEQGSFDAQRGIGFGFNDWYNCVKYCEDNTCENGKYCKKSC